MDAIEKAAMKQYQLDVEAGLVQPSAAMIVAQKEAEAATMAKEPAVDSKPTSTGLLKVTSSPAPASTTEKENSNKDKEDGQPSLEPAVVTPPVKPKDETVGQPGEWQTVEAPVSEALPSQRQGTTGGGVIVEDDDEEAAGNPEDLKRFKIVEKTYPVDDDDGVMGEDGASGGPAVFKKRKGGASKARNIRRKL
ncbi:hypothetical protein EC991_003886 [Linnemannia zychae]|nr:hypothetical protein EC991_003886 [Linnemannia zychae]